MNIHINYETAKRLKEFLGESAPEPMYGEMWVINRKCPSVWWIVREIPVNGMYYGPAYQLHDLLSKPFCEAFREKFYLTNSKRFRDLWTRREMAQILAMHYQDGGLPAVEKALMEMMEDK